ncbi:heavy metal translocating P-type ATPase [Pelosinus propionicus]|uniref:Cd(2+)-exporting ATPase n=1 Tax=Pelosinus propionicus DSM 13327 TaxID=1123291 RepID=A0A1I4I9R6_9FIRM|nr:heavy metal translocating P-type ATPase [Pelosinus propionicus]SFL50793.1 Cd2+/Zn2+-exporting ATPase [Pelosinus propionicus DSM 13327]
MANKTQFIGETKHSCNDSCCSESSAALTQPEIPSCSCCSPEDSPTDADRNHTGHLDEEADAIEEHCDCCSHPAAPATAKSDISVNNFTITGLDCGDCAIKLEKGLRKQEGILDVKVNFATAKMKVTHNHTIIQAAEIAKIVSSFGYKASLINAINQQSQFHKSVFTVSGLDCGDCANKLEKHLSTLTGVHSANVNFAAAKLTVEHATTDSAIIQAVSQVGYKAEMNTQSIQHAKIQEEWWNNPKTQATIGSGIILAISMILDWLAIGDIFIVPLYVLAAIIGGYSTAKSGFYSMRSLTFDMNFLMTVAVIGAFAIGEWGEGATVAFLFSFGNTLQTYTMDKTRQSIRALMELAPAEALVVRNGLEQKLPVEEIVIGDHIIVKPGERIAMDGIVKNGTSAVNQATITGESLPVEKTIGDGVYAGTVNEHGALEIEVTKIATDSTLAKIMHLVEEAQSQKAPSQQFVDLFAKYYTPAVLAIAAGIMVVPWLLFNQPFSPWFYKGLVLLVISCPCALVISTPVSIVSAIGNSSRNGVLIKGGAYLEQMGTIRAIAFDKTGTLTHGHPRVTDIISINSSQEDVLTTAASIEKWSEHPLAVAIVEKSAGLTLRSVTNFKALVGLGAQADINSQTIFIGNPRLFEDLGLDLSPYQKQITDLQQQGKTLMLLGTQDNLHGMIAVADTLRENSKDALVQLREAGIKHIAMLTGDNRQVAGSIAKELNIDTLYSELLPQDKVATINELLTNYQNVAMVGDGVNDAPAMAASTIGVAMGVAGSDTALETADIALMSDDLGKLAYVIKLSNKTLSIIKQNISFSIIVKVIFVILTFTGIANLWLAVFADTGSSILVTLNGMRLMRKIN